MLPEVIELFKPTKTPNARFFLVIFLQIAALSGLAIAQPLLQLVRENPEFLVVHHSGGWDVIILAGVLLFLPPLALSAIVFLASLIRAKAGLLIHSLILGGLLALTLLPLVGKIPAVNGWMTLILASAPAIIMACRFGRSNFLGQILGYLALAVPVFLFMFLGSGPIMRILFPDAPSAAGSAQTVGNPVVMIIFDEFPTTSLMGPDQELDCQLFPNFCRLADRSIWYRNATSISGATLRSVPAILSGKFPAWNATPSLADHPQNIFTLLGSSYQVSALETQTNLCPDELKSEPVPGLSQRLNLLFTDLSILYKHLVVPKLWRSKLVPVSNKWGNFQGHETRANNGGYPETKMDQFGKFVSSLQVSDKPNLVVAHILFPHNPYKFFPNGTVYTWREKVTLMPDGTWGPDRVKMAHSYRRHILQSVAADRLLGKLLDRLEKLDIFDAAAIVVTADHGASFRTGLSHRRFSHGNEADIMSVPLFIKLPGQTTGNVDDRFAQTVDILPTLVSVLGCDPGWSFDGLDLLSETSVDRTELDFKDQDANEKRTIPTAILNDRNEIVRWKNELFGDDGGYERLFSMGDSGGLIGKDVTGLQLKDHVSLRGTIIDAQKLEKVDLKGLFVPAEINGTLNGHNGNGRLDLALALNGKIAGVTETYLDGPEPNTFNWQIMTSLEGFRDGSNEVELFLVPDPSSGLDLMRIPLTIPSFMDTNLGGICVGGVTEKGLFNSHDWGGQLVRWTNGKGRWEIPLKPGEKPEMLTIKIVSSGPPGADLNVTVNGTRILSQVLPHGEWDTRLPLNSIKSKDHLTVVLESRVFIPAENDPNSSDHRKLGVAVSTLMVK